MILTMILLSPAGAQDDLDSEEAFDESLKNFG